MNDGLREPVMARTAEYGGEWGVNHALRLIATVADIGSGMEYDADAVWLAAYLHDWGGYSPWLQDGVDHAVRSAQVVQGFLDEHGVPEPLASLVIECIELHHRGPDCKSVESMLLADADALDFLGVTGVLRDFSKTPRDLRKAFETSRKRMERLPSMLRTERAKELAEKRVADMKALFTAFEGETGGVF